MTLTFDPVTPESIGLLRNPQELLHMILVHMIYVWTRKNTLFDNRTSVYLTLL